MATVKEKMLGLMNLPELLGLRSEMQVHNCTVTVYTVDYGLYTGDEKDRRPGGRLAGHSTGCTGGCPLLGQVRQSSIVLYCPLPSYTVLYFNILASNVLYYSSLLSFTVQYWPSILTVMVFLYCVWLYHQVLCGPTSKERFKGIGTNQENLEGAGKGS